MNAAASNNTCHKPGLYFSPKLFYSNAVINSNGYFIPEKLSSAGIPTKL